MPLAETYSLVFQPKFVVHDDTFHRAVYSQGLTPTSEFVTGGGSAVISIITDDGIYPYQPPVPILQQQYRSPKRLWWEEAVPPSAPPLDDYCPKTVFSTQSAVVSGFATAGGAFTPTFAADDPYTRVSRPAPSIRKVQWWDEFLKQVLIPVPLAIDDPYLRLTRPSTAVQKRVWWDEFLQQTATAPAFDDLPSPASWSGIASTRSTIAYSTYLNTEWRKRLDAQGWFSQVTFAPAVDDGFRKIVFSSQFTAISGFATSAATGFTGILMDDPFSVIARPSVSVRKRWWWDEFFQQTTIAPAVDDYYRRLTRPATSTQKRLWWEDLLPPNVLVPAVDDYLRVARPSISVQKRTWWDEFLQQVALGPALDDLYRKTVFSTQAVPVSGYATSGAAAPLAAIPFDDVPRKRMSITEFIAVSSYAGIGAAGLSEIPFAVDDSGIRFTATVRIPYRIVRRADEAIVQLAAALIVSDDGLKRQIPLIRLPLPRHPYLVQEIFPVIAGPIPDDPYRRAVFVTTVLVLSGYASGTAGPVAVGFVADDVFVGRPVVAASARARRWVDEAGNLLPPAAVPGVDVFVRRATFTPPRPLTVKQWAMLEGFPGELIPPDDPFTFLVSSVVTQVMPWEASAEPIVFSPVVPQLVESMQRKAVFTSIIVPVSSTASFGANISVQGTMDDPVRQWPTQRPYRPGRWRDEPIMVPVVAPPVPAESPFRMPTPLWVPPSKRIWVPDDFIIIPPIVLPTIGELCVEVSDSAAHIELFTFAAQCELATSSAGVELQTNLCRAGHRPQF